MNEPRFSEMPAKEKLYASLVLGVICAFLSFSNTGVISNSEKVDSPTNSSIRDVVKHTLPSLSAGPKYYEVSQTSKGVEDLAFDQSVTSLLETSQQRLDLLVATLENTPTRAKNCANTTVGIVCQRLYSVMADAITSLEKAEASILQYQKNGKVADPILAKVESHVRCIRQVALKYPGIGPRLEP